MKKTGNIAWPWVVIVLLFMALLVAYIYCFGDRSISGDPADWGAIGDYLGGIINPFVSTLTLFFLVKTYTAQKEELRETKEALVKTEAHSKQTAGAQIRLVEIQAQQSEISSRLMAIQLLSNKLNARNSTVIFLQGELERCTTAIVNNRSSVGLDGEKLDELGLISYRLILLKKIKQEIDDITMINVNIEVVGS